MFDPQMMQNMMMQMKGGQGPIGFMNPGSMPTMASGAPQILQAGPQMQRGGMSAMPSIPSALGANGQPQGAPGGGMFSQLAQNPQLMQMLAGKMGGPQQLPGGQPGGVQPSLGGMQMGNFNPQDIQRMTGMFANGMGMPTSGPQGQGGQGGIQDLLRRMFGG